MSIQETVAAAGSGYAGPAGWKLRVVYAEAAVYGVFAGIGMGATFGIAGLLMAIPLGVLHVWCAKTAHEFDTSNPRADRMANEKGEKE